MTNERSFVANRNGTVLVRVYPISGGPSTTGRFEIGYDISPSQAPGTQRNPIPLSPSTMIEGNITSRTFDNQLWYTFNVNSGQTYSIRWNDSDSGFDTFNIMVSAFLDGLTIFTRADSNNERSFTANRNGTVLVMVYPIIGGPSTGRFQIGYE